MTLYRKQMDTIKSHQNQWPVQVVPIARDLGLNVYRVPNWPKTVSGMIKKDGADAGETGYAIYVNAEHPETRRRFTIAHEIAHFVLHESLIGDGIVEDALMRAEGFSSRIESQANAFAADILMPWNLIDRARDQGMMGIQELALAFNVSDDAMSIRLYKVQFHDGVFMENPAPVAG